MHLIIPASLPPSAVAADLLAHLKSQCPTLVQRLERMSADYLTHAPEEEGCTALEYLELKRHGYARNAGHTFGAGLGAWRAGMTSSLESVWIADLCSVAIGREGAQLSLPESVQIDDHEADALFDAAKPLWTGTGISILPLKAGRWRVWLPEHAQLNSISPAAVSTLAVADWWPQHPSMKPWRKLLNEIQMLWHEHPVNLDRASRGLSPINSAWLYGGAPGWKPAESDERPVFYEGLQQSFLRGEWSEWIAQLPALSNYLKTIPPDATISLVGERRFVELTPIKFRWWNHFLPSRTQNWTNWWTRQK